MDLMIHDIDIVLGARGLAARCGWPPRGPRCTPRSPTSPPCRSGSQSGAIATITASRATEEKIRTLAITQPDAYIVLDYTEQDIHIYRAGRPGVHDEPGLASATAGPRSSSTSRCTATTPSSSRSSTCSTPTRRRRRGEAVMLAQPDDLRSLAMALEIERMIRDGVAEVAWRDPVPVTRALARSDVRRRPAAGADGGRGATAGLARRRVHLSRRRRASTGWRRRRRSPPRLEAMARCSRRSRARRSRGCCSPESSGWAISSARRRRRARTRRWRRGPAPCSTTTSRA